MPLWARLLVLRWTIREKERALRDFGIDHVIFRLGWLSDDPATADIVLAEGGGPMTGSVPHADVVRLMVRARWKRWNHVRAVAAVVAFVLYVVVTLSLGASFVEPF